MRGIVLSVLGSVMLASSVQAAPRESAGTPEAGRYDGAWVFEARVTVGSCPGLLPGSIEIRGDLLVGTQAAAAAFAAGRMAHWGYVESDGAIMTRFTSQDGHVARAHGQLRGNSGSGAWSSSTDKCGGTWRAQRGGAQRAGR
ncbi:MULTISPECIES: hypothetical protein [Methylosinus]|uniref:DUF2147 domain-containing protein n=1 Tax=Methylosinus trichosporium (strain ATCC 35070 / NCIMB 11131 / UNIQEM 75 / OB3b) TaxID=595536 RepID=A0A2D2D3C1_METT3|nr:MULTISPECIES: hypothetical protein [Methylosinus]ATQ69465.1 hypothetical protein CQW49_17445 [Methylosinus trichosporium OB3b]OBS52975.1 hypothetical protein A8B73_08855 [Methylosinus sp. 3S-1]